MKDDASVLPIANEPITGSLREHLVGALARVIPRDIRIATAYLTPDGFMELKDGMGSAQSVRLLLGERPFMNRRGPGDVLSQPGDTTSFTALRNQWTGTRSWKADTPGCCSPMRNAVNCLPGA